MAADQEPQDAVDARAYGEPHAMAVMYADFVKAQAAFKSPPKNKTARVKMKAGGEYTYRYADLPDVIHGIRPILAKHNLAFSQSVSSLNGTIGVSSRLLHASGGSIEGDVLYLPAGSTPQEAGSAITYARRYSLCALLGIAADDDDDADNVPSAAGPATTAGAATTDDGRITPTVGQAGGSTSADQGEVSAATEPGEGSSAPFSPSPGSPSFPLDPLECPHVWENGGPSRVKGKAYGIEGDICGRCGLPWITAVEGTTADLGPATDGAVLGPGAEGYGG